jgi:hypothetical protein
MFNGKLHDEEDDELPRYEEEEDDAEGAERPLEGTIEIEEIAIEGDEGDEDSVESPAPRSSAPSPKKKPAKKPAPKKKAKSKSKPKPKRKSKPKKGSKAKGGKRKRR